MITRQQHHAGNGNHQQRHPGTSNCHGHVGAGCVSQEERPGSNGPVPREISRGLINFRKTYFPRVPVSLPGNDGEVHLANRMSNAGSTTRQQERFIVNSFQGRDGIAKHGATPARTHGQPAGIPPHVPRDLLFQVCTSPNPKTLLSQGPQSGHRSRMRSLHLNFFSGLTPSLPPRFIPTDTHPYRCGHFLTPRTSRDAVFHPTVPRHTIGIHKMR